MWSLLSVVAGYPTICHSKHDLLINAKAASSRCEECETYHKRLHTMATREKFDLHSTSTNPNSHTNYRYLTRSQLSTRLHNKHDEHWKSGLQLERLKKKIREVCECEHGVALDEEKHEYLKASLEDYVSARCKHVPVHFRRFSGINSSKQHHWRMPNLWSGTSLWSNDAATCRKQLWIVWKVLVVLNYLENARWETIHVPTSHKKLYTFQTMLIDSCKKPGMCLGVEFQKCVVYLVDEIHIKDNLVFDKYCGHPGIYWSWEHKQSINRIWKIHNGLPRSPLIHDYVDGSWVIDWLVFLICSFLHLLQLETCYLTHCGMLWLGLNGVA